MKNGNWVNIVWAGIGFAIFGLYLEKSLTVALIGAGILISWLIFVFGNWIKR